MIKYSNSNENDMFFCKLNSLLKRRNKSSFWNELKRQRKTRMKSKLQPYDFTEFYSGVMRDAGDRAEEQLADKTREEAYNHRCCEMTFVQTVNPSDVVEMIRSLHPEKSLRIDGITPEHLKHGLSETLCVMLSKILSLIFCVHCGWCLPLSFSTIRPE